MQHEKSFEVLKTVSLANITSDLFPALDLKFFQFWNEKKKIGQQLYAFNVFVTIMLLQSLDFFYLWKFLKVDYGLL